MIFLFMLKKGRVMIEARYSHKKTPAHARSIVRKQGLFFPAEQVVLLFLHSHDGFDALAARGILVGLVDVFEVVELHDLVHRESALAVVFDHLGDEHLGLRRAFDDAGDGLALGHTGRQLRPPG